MMKNNNTFQFGVKITGKALLVEPSYKTKFPSLPLLKFSTFLKDNGYKTYYVKGIKDVQGDFDEILVSTLFTTDWTYCIDAINYYSEKFKNAHFSIGGIYASLLPKHIYKYTGIKPFIGCIKEVDEYTPDYSLLLQRLYDNTSHIVTTRGCPVGCKFCSSKLLEPEPRIIKNWKNHFLPGGKFAVIHDNNIITHGDDHFFNVLDFFRKNKLKFYLDNGFDCRFFHKNHAKKLSKVPITEIRFAFDTMEQDGYIQEAIERCIQYGIKPRKIEVFVLYNYEDDVEEALYRAKEIRKFGARPYAMRYKPLKWLNPNRIYVSKNWDLREMRDFHQYVNKHWFMDKYSYEEWKKKKNKYLVKRKKKIKKSTDENGNIKEWINAGKINAEKNKDGETIFNNSDFIISYLNGK